MCSDCSDDEDSTSGFGLIDLLMGAARERSRKEKQRQRRKPPGQHCMCVLITHMPEDESAGREFYMIKRPAEDRAEFGGKWEFPHERADVNEGRYWIDGVYDEMCDFICSFDFDTDRCSGESYKFPPRIDVIVKGVKRFYHSELWEASSGSEENFKPIKDSPKHEARWVNISELPKLKMSNAMKKVYKIHYPESDPWFKPKATQKGKAKATQKRKAATAAAPDSSDEETENQDPQPSTSSSAKMRKTANN